MNPALKPAMMDSISKVFETMFFLPLETRDSADDSMVPFELPSSVRASSIQVKNGISGAFLLIISETLLVTMAANFMGQNPAQVSPSQLEGTLKEALNMIAGNTISIFSPEEDFELEIPELVAEIPLLAGLAGARTTVCTHTLDGELAAVFSFQPAAGSVQGS